jgi:hypothetical protein
VPYDPANPEEFRDILRRLRDEEFLTTAAIINIVVDARGPSTAPGRRQFEMPVSALNRFIVTTHLG